MFQRNNLVVEPELMQRMRQAMAHWGPDGVELWLDGHVGLGQLRLRTTPEAHLEHLPQYDKEFAVAFSAEGRVDNRQELIEQLKLEGDIPDGDVIFAAYRQWGEDTPLRIYGDWSFAAWHPKEQKLFLARDHIGTTALYYYLDDKIFAFASDRQALLALNLAQWEMDELYLGQVMISWPDYHGERTIYKQIKRLPPAHSLTVTPEKFTIRQYWHLENTPELHLPRREDYVAAFREQFDRAVRDCLRSPNGKVAVTLSGGLDSGAVTATAAEILKRHDQGLDAYTSVPIADTQPYVGQRFGDEFPFAQATAEFAGNVNLFQIAGDSISPISAIRLALETAGEPGHAAGNQYWLWELLQTAHQDGHRVLLTGQMGNAGISWIGDYHSQPLSYQLKRLGWRKWGKEEIKHWAPESAIKARFRRRLEKNKDNSNSAINPDFAQRIDIWERRLAEDQKPPKSPLENRLNIIKPGRSFIGALHAQNGAANRLEVRDPTGDARLLAFTLSVPDHIFIDPQTGLDRWLIREAMVGRLPDEVRLNTQRGRQAGDLVPRLRNCADEVESTLDELANGPAAAYVDVPYMHKVWQQIESEDSTKTFGLSITVLTRGIMAGLFVNQFFDQQD